MFYAQTLLSRNGPLGTIWVAAYCHKRLKKDQVAVTDISSSVDEIMLHKVTITYRVLGYLLLGVVRIYSKKVDYLYHDCNEILVRINKFSVNGKAKPQIEAMCAQHVSITLPDRFELDAFDLEVSKDVSRCNTRPREEMLEAIEDESRECYSLIKHHSSEPSFQLGICPSAYTTFDDAQSPHIRDLDMVVNMVVCQSQNSSSLESNMKMVQCSQFAQEECQDHDMLGIEVPLDMGPQFDRVDNRAEKINLPEIRQLDIDYHHAFAEDHPVAITPGRTPRESECPYLDIFGVSEEPLDLDPQFDKVDNQTKRIKFLEISPLDIEHNVTTDDHQIALTPDGTQHESKFICAPGSATTELAVPTPAQREQVRISRKRKHVYDSVVVLPNKVLRQSIHDSSGLVTKRRKVPHTAFDVWRTHRISRLRQDFIEPLLLGISSELKLLFYESTAKTEGLAEVAAGPSHSAPELGFETPCKSSEQKPAFQENSVDESTSVRPVEVPNTGVTQVATVEKDLSPTVMEEDLLLDLINEDVSPHEENNQDLDGWTVRTRAVARYLQKRFLNQKEHKDKESLSLEVVLKGRTRKENARLFYEILVLKTKGFMDVKQENPYDDILVLATSLMERI